MSFKGIDVSNYQSGLNWNTVDTDICIIKVSQGVNYISPSFKSQYAKCREKGIKVGFYHFLDGTDALSQAKYFLNAISGLKSDCKYVIDAETNPIGVSARIRVFADYLISQGKEPCLYTGLSFYNTEVLDNCKDLDLWVAKYGGSRPSVKSVGWQYCGTTLDLNVFDEGILLSNTTINKTNNIILSAKPSASSQSNVDTNVLALQKKLNKLGFKGSNGQKLSEDGISGHNTTACIRTFQIALGLVGDAIAGVVTMNAINSILAKPLLKVGSKGIVVKYLQRRMSTNDDSCFGNNTFISVKAFQKKNGLVSDGIFGDASWKKLIG